MYFPFSLLFNQYTCYSLSLPSFKLPLISTFIYVFVLSQDLCVEIHINLLDYLWIRSIWTCTSTLNSIYSKQLIILPFYPFLINLITIHFPLLFKMYYHVFISKLQIFEAFFIFSHFHTCQSQSVNIFKDFHCFLFLLPECKFKCLFFLIWTVTILFFFMLLCWLPTQQ